VLRTLICTAFCGVALVSGAWYGGSASGLSGSERSPSPDASTATRPRRPLRKVFFASRSPLGEVDPWSGCIGMHKFRAGVRQANHGG